MKSVASLVTVLAVVVSANVVAATPSNSSQGSNQQGGWQYVGSSDVQSTPKYNDEAAHPVANPNESNYNYSGQKNSSTSDQFSSQSPSSSATASDTELGNRVRQQLASDSTAKNVRVSVNTGKVTLKGTVASNTDKQRIETAVKRVNGVSSVDNSLTIQAQ